MRWDPEQYLRFAAERGRPFTDLLARVDVPARPGPSYVVDLGCGPGGLTATLADRWPSATVVGVDSSAEMVAKASALARPGRLEFVEGDLRTWEPARPVDVLVSNATLQWVPDHLELLPRLASWLAPGGWLAFQVPGNFGSPSHVELAALRTSPRWRERVGEGAERAAVAEPEGYLEALAGLGLDVDAWETTYLQVLPGEDAVLEWMKGTGLRPVLSRLDDEEAAQFLEEYAVRLREAYPQQEFGTVLPFRRIFVVARDRRHAGEAGAVPTLDALHHVQLAAPRGSEDALREFFVGVLGMTEIAKPPALAARGGAWFRAGTLELHVGVEDDFRPARKAHPGLLAGSVEDLRAVGDRLEAHGAPVVWDDGFPGHARFYTEDPHGNRLELMARLPA